MHHPLYLLYGFLFIVFFALGVWIAGRIIPTQLAARLPEDKRADFLRRNARSRRRMIIGGGLIALIVTLIWALQ